MLIVEGTDLVGKTTLCKRVLQEVREMCARQSTPMPIIYNHFSRLPDGWDYRYDYHRHVRRHVVQDRFHMSEIAYGIVTRGHTNIDYNRYREIDAWCRLAGSVTVVILASEERIKRNWDKHSARGEMFDLETTLRVNTVFKELADIELRRPSLLEYKIDTDFAYTLSATGWPAEDDVFVKDIANAWYCRLATHEATRWLGRPSHGAFID